MARILRVSEAASLKAGHPQNPKRSKIYKPGEEFPEGVLSSEQIKRHIKAGYLVDGSQPAPAIPADLQPRLPGIDESGRPAGRAPKAAKPAKSKSIWSMDPDGLRGLDVDQLNVMIAERDDSVEPFETSEEALAFLSADYEGPE